MTKYKDIKLFDDDEYRDVIIDIPEVDNAKVLPKVKILNSKGKIQTRKIGFNRDLFEDI